MKQVNLTIKEYFNKISNSFNNLFMFNNDNVDNIINCNLIIGDDNKVIMPLIKGDDFYIKDNSNNMIKVNSDYNLTLIID